MLLLALSLLNALLPSLLRAQSTYGESGQFGVPPPPPPFAFPSADLTCAFPECFDGFRLVEQGKAGQPRLNLCAYVTSDVQSCDRFPSVPSVPSWRVRGLVAGAAR